MVLIGSYTLPENLRREYRDIDLIVTKEELFELEIIQEIKFENLFKIYGKKNDIIYDLVVVDNMHPLWEFYLRESKSPELNLEIGTVNICSELGLLQLKRSHVYTYSKKSSYNLLHYSYLYQRVKPTSKELTLLKEWEDLMIRYRRSLGEHLKTPKLKDVSTEEFFTDSVIYLIPHDDIHEIVKHKEKPMYQYCQLDPNMVEIDRNLFDSLSEEDKKLMVLEEAYVLAIERVLLFKPYINNKILLDSVIYSLSRICTNITSGFFRAYAAKNFNTLTKEYNLSKLHTDLNKTRCKIKHQTSKS